ncbi:MAG: glycosyltransferase family 4 protein [Caldilineaceae bacterium]|nr:glycosyltransferase family 4 protein [Caldilineaceae bacterium]
MGEPARVHLLIGDLRLGDAASEHLFVLTRVLLDAGYAPEILVNHRPGPLPDDLRSRIHHVHPGDYTPQADLTIVQYPIWYPLADAIERAPGASIFWYHGVTDPALWPDAERDLLLTAAARTNLAWHATLAVATSPYTAAELQRYANLPAERIRIVPLSVDAASFHPLAVETDALRRSLNLTGKRVLLYVGRVVEHKRIDLMLEALAALDRSDVHLLIVGDNGSTVAAGELTARLMEEAAALGVAQQITFTGRVPHVAPYFALADVYLQTSRHEGFGVPLVEAMAAGAPIVAAAGGAMPWVLQADEATPAGLLFAPDDPAQLVAQLARLLDDPELAAGLVAQGRVRVGDFSPQNFAARALAAVEEALTLEANAANADPVMPREALLDAADVALRHYQVRSQAPLVDPLIEWARVNSTTHIKEAYFDRMVEQQVNYNRRLAQEIVTLHARVREMTRQLDEREA